MTQRSFELGDNSIHCPALLDNSQLPAIEAAAVEFAALAGRGLLERFRTGLAVEYKGRGHANPVTAADREAEELLRSQIMTRFPEHGVLGEEGAEPRPDTPFVWVVDPLDGTTNFINGLPLWCVSVGVLWHGRPVAGAIFTPSGPTAAPTTFHARRGGGAYRDGAPLSLASEPEPTRRRLATLPAHYWKEMRFRSRGPETLGETRTLGSIALEMALVAAGALQYGIFWSPKIWDVAAGAIIISEAGGAVLTRGRPGAPWLDLHQFEPRANKDSPRAALRHWRGSIVAGADPAARVVATDISIPRLAAGAVKKVAGRVMHGAQSE